LFCIVDLLSHKEGVPLRIFLLLYFITQLQLFGFEIIQKPVASIELPSFYNIKKTPERYVGNKRRLATASGVAWSPNNQYLVSLNLAGHQIDVYEFDSLNISTKLLYSLTNDDGLKLVYPVNLSFSKTGELLAVTNSRNGLVNIYKVAIENCIIDPNPILTLGFADDRVPHGIKFTEFKGKEYLAYCIGGSSSRIDVYALDWHSNGLCFTLFKSVFAPFATNETKVKGLDFSSNGRAIAVCCSSGAGNEENNPQGKIFSCYFPWEEGNILKPSRIFSSNSALEDVAFYQDRFVLTSEQMDSLILAYRVNPKTKNCMQPIFQLEPGVSEIDFPHGLALSRDQKFLAISNFGTTSIKIYQLTSSNSSNFICK
jgi:WD40 repeat protein